MRRAPARETAAAAEPQHCVQPFFCSLFDRRTWAGVLVSGLLHSAFLALLALWWFDTGSRNSGINSLLAILGDERDEGPALEDSALRTVELSGGAEATGPLVPEPISSQGAEPLLDSLLGTGPGSGSKEGDGGGAGAGGYVLPADGRVTTRGSFTAWTVPADPAPGEDYKIIIQVEYKRPGQKLRYGDVTGQVIGTDTYRQVISEQSRRTKYLIKANQVVVDVPGAVARVKDTIQVRSGILKETQTLEIEF
jgi:hypothetical protein